MAAQSPSSTQPGLPELQPLAVSSGACWGQEPHLETCCTPGPRGPGQHALASLGGSLEHCEPRLIAFRDLDNLPTPLYLVGPYSASRVQLMCLCLQEACRGYPGSVHLSYRL